MIKARRVESGRAPKLRAGDVVSFSTTPGNSNHLGYRVLSTALQLSKYQAMIELLGLQTNVVPFVINAAPAPMGSIPFAVSVDSYLNLDVIIHALRLCAAKTGVAIIVCHPLFALHIATSCKRLNMELPISLSFILGGYYCPVSAERYLLNTVRSCSSACSVLHSYGIADVDAAILVGKRGQNDCISYKVVSNACTVQAVEGFLTIETEHGRFVPGDKAQQHEGQWLIDPDERRLSSAVREDLESWTDTEWSRRTGYVYSRSDGSIAQLRKGLQRDSPGEMDYYDFARWTDMNWLHKPDWRIL